jgi:RNase P/RNase MRP subunit p30
VEKYSLKYSQTESKNTTKTSSTTIKLALSQGCRCVQYSKIHLINKIYHINKLKGKKKTHMVILLDAENL